MGSTEDVVPTINCSRQTSTSPRSAVSTATAVEKGPLRHAPVAADDCTHEGPLLCQAIGCKADLLKCNSYCIRRRLCREHLAAEQVQKRTGDPTLWRFCQQCGKLEPLDRFQGKRRSCQNRLQKRRSLHSAKQGSQIEAPPSRKPRCGGLNVETSTRQQQQQHISPSDDGDHHQCHVRSCLDQAQGLCCSADVEANSRTVSGSALSPLVSQTVLAKAGITQQQAAPGPSCWYDGTPRLMASPPGVSSAAAAGSCGGRSSTTGTDFASRPRTHDCPAYFAGNVQLRAPLADGPLGFCRRQSSWDSAHDRQQQLCFVGGSASLTSTPSVHGRPGACQKPPPPQQQQSQCHAGHDPLQQTAKCSGDGVQVVLPAAAQTAPKQAGYFDKYYSAAAEAATTASNISAASCGFQSLALSNIQQSTAVSRPIGHTSAIWCDILDILLVNSDLAGPPLPQGQTLQQQPGTEGGGQNEAPLTHVHRNSAESWATSFRATFTPSVMPSQEVAAGGGLSCSLGTWQQQEAAAKAASVAGLVELPDRQQQQQQQEQIIAGAVARTVAAPAGSCNLQVPLLYQQQSNMTVYTADDLDRAADEVSASTPFCRAILSPLWAASTDEQQQLPQITDVDDAGLPLLTSQQLEASAAAAASLCVAEAAVPQQVATADRESLNAADLLLQPPQQQQQQHMPPQQQSGSASDGSLPLLLTSAAADSCRQRMPQLSSQQDCCQGHLPADVAAPAAPRSSAAPAVGSFNPSMPAIAAAAAVDVITSTTPAAPAWSRDPRDPGSTASSQQDTKVLEYFRSQAPFSGAHSILAQQQQLQQQQQQLIQQLQAAGAAAAAAAVTAPAALLLFHTPPSVDSCRAALPANSSQGGEQLPQAYPSGRLKTRTLHCNSHHLDHHHHHQQQQQQLFDAGKWSMQCSQGTPALQNAGHEAQCQVSQIRASQMLILQESKRQKRATNLPPALPCELLQHKEAVAEVPLEVLEHLLLPRDILQQLKHGMTQAKQPAAQQQQQQNATGLNMGTAAGVLGVQLKAMTHQLSQVQKQLSDIQNELVKRAPAAPTADVAG